MSRPLSHRIYTEVLSKWPKQELRPDYQLQDVIRATIDKRFQAYQPSMEAEELFKARSLQFLQQNRWNEKYKLSGQMLKPTSQPTYFDDLIREIEEAPKRTWFERLGKRLSGMIRLS
uniref:Ubiquinol-cytochrome-c reductase complex assembly factor 2 n=1 Tax=Bionectria ochroleuca TaxID=29856 RepID=A0A8H7N4W7_BIOOC